MKYPPSILEEIRARLPVSAVVGKRVRLIKAGKEWKGLSPFNAEKTPSFYVNDQKGFYHCFSSGKHGDIFRFLMEVDGLPFPEAVERLAAEAGVALPKVSREAEAQEEKRKSLVDVVELACRFFEAQLQAKVGARARTYLEGRDLTPDLQRHFRLGFAPNEKFALRDHLAEQGVASDAMVEAGLLVTGEEIAVPYDRFRDRVMFPIADARGRIIAFGGRALSPDAQAKYLNSPETPLFSKGRLLYNHHQARKAAHASARLVAVEGYVDVIAMSAAGFPETVAPLGTALTEDQLALMWRMADEPILCFDGDKAGQRAAFRAVDVALPHLKPGKSLRFALLPGGQDPDDLARSGGGAAIQAVLDKARPLVDVAFEREAEAQPIDTPERRAAFERRIADLVGRIGDGDVRRLYRDAMDERLAALFPPVSRPYGRRTRDEGRHGRSGRPASWTSAARAPLAASAALKGSALFTRPQAGLQREAMILATLIAHPALLERHAEEIVALDFGFRDIDRLRGFLIELASQGARLPPEVVEGRLHHAGLSSVVDRLRREVRPGDAWALAPEAPEDKVGDALRQAITLHRKMRTLHSELAAAEHALAEDGDEAALAWLADIKSQISSLEGAEADRESLEGAAKGFGG